MTKGEEPLTFAARQRQDLTATLSEMVETLDRYENMICKQARREVELLFPAVLKKLSRGSSTPELGSDGWPHLQPLAKAGFLAHLFWARHQFDFSHYSDHFWDEVRRTCSLVVVEEKLLQGEAGDFVFEACSIENGTASPHDALDWAAAHLAKMSWSGLMLADLSILSDYGITNPFQDPSEFEDETE